MCLCEVTKPGNVTLVTSLLAEMSTEEGLRMAIWSGLQNQRLRENKEQSTGQNVLSNNFFVFNIN